MDEFGNEAESGANPDPGGWVDPLLLLRGGLSGPQPETRLNGRLDERATRLGQHFVHPMKTQTAQIPFSFI